MTEDQPHVPAEPGAPAPAPAHDDGDHGHTEEPLGPIDVAAWGAGVVGVGVAVVTALCFALATGAIAAG